MTSATSAGSAVVPPPLETARSTWARSRRAYAASSGAPESSASTVFAWNAVVRYAPGATVQTRMPNGRHSRASASVNPSIANLVEQ